MLHQWKSSIENVEQYQQYLMTLSTIDGYVCQCTDVASFGKHCEYRLPSGSTFSEAANSQYMLKLSTDNLYYEQLYGDIICYTTLVCNFGRLCLGWRDICDDIQQCMSGLDEENCDKLEFNECENDEYRCMNGMCIPQNYFLDEQTDCLDWSDEIEHDDNNCRSNEIHHRWDDRICPPYQYSCGDGQCIADRFAFMESSRKNSDCRSLRDQYFMCEIHFERTMWTYPNGRCYVGKAYKQLNPSNSTNDGERCYYIFLCHLSGAAESNCPCGNDSMHSCTEYLRRNCNSEDIQYPRGGIMAPHVSFLYRINETSRPAFIRVTGTISCGGKKINITDIQFPFISNIHKLENNICVWAQNNLLFDHRMPDYCISSNSSSFNSHTQFNKYLQ